MDDSPIAWSRVGPLDVPQDPMWFMPNEVNESDAGIVPVPVDELRLHHGCNARKDLVV